MSIVRIALLPLLAGILSCAHSTNEIPPIHKKMFGLLENFDRFDEDGDGYLSRSELEKGVNSLGPERLTKEQFDWVMLVYDTNQDQKISLEEAKAATANGPIVFEN